MSLAFRLPLAVISLAAALGLLVWALMRPPSLRTPEPVRFAAVQPELFAEGGALTDAWADFDGDGDPDRFVGFNGTRSRLYRNDRSEGFVEVAAEMGLTFERSVRTSAWGDFDADGDPDLLLGFAGDAPVTALFRNDGASGFVDVAHEVGLLLSEGVTRQASWIDYDSDGDLDLFLALRDRENRLYRNDISGPAATFTDVTRESGIGDPRRTVGAVWFDADQDGDLDVVTANMNGDANGLWIQDSGRFADAAAGTAIEAGGRGVGDEALGTVRPCVVDYDADGRLDQFFTNYGPNALVRGTPDGWESVGDMGYLDVDGYLYLGDRRSDMILCGGRNIYPAEVEAALEAHPMVCSAVVLGLPDEEMGQRIHAIVQTQMQTQIDGRDLDAHLRQQLVHYKVPSSIEFVEHALRDESGKVRRSALREERIRGVRTQGGAE